MDNTFSILVAEDDAGDVLLYERVFKREQVPNRVCFVSTGEEVIQYLIGVGKFADRNVYPIPGLILLDIKMPKVSGLEALRWIRQDRRFKDVPVIIVSSSVLPRDHDQAYAFGATAYFAKTVAFVGLWDTIREKTGLWKELPLRSLPTVPRPELAGTRAMVG
jgi:CheY-like chemotaxis protein